MEQDIDEAVNDVLESITGDVDVSEEYVREKIEEYLSYDVPMDQARDGAISKICDEYDVSRAELLGTEKEAVQLGNISDSVDEWVDFEAKVVDLWDNENDSIEQVGLIDDGTNRIKFISWASNDPPIVEEGQVYSFSNLPVSEYEGNYEVTITSSSTVEEIDKEIDTGFEPRNFSGLCVNVSDGSGLINEETEDGDMEHRLRLVGTVDDGYKTYMFELDEELTEALTGVSLHSAKELVQEHLSDDIVVQKMRDAILGQYITIEGVNASGSNWINNIESASVEEDYSVSADDLEELLVRARSMEV